MAVARPYASKDELHDTADCEWTDATREDILEAFGHHPRIGDVDALRTKFSSTRAWSVGEQSGVAKIDMQTLQSLADGNRAYEDRFGFIFIVCATGKSAQDILSLLNERLAHDPGQEIAIAAEEQRKIMHIRLDNLISQTVTSDA